MTPLIKQISLINCNKINITLLEILNKKANTTKLEILKIKGKSLIMGHKDINLFIENYILQLA